MSHGPDSIQKAAAPRHIWSPACLAEKPAVLDADEPDRVLCLSEDGAGAVHLANADCGGRLPCSAPTCCSLALSKDTVAGVHYLLHRHGWSHQVLARRAMERDEAAITGWMRETWPSVETSGRRSGPGWSSRRGQVLPAYVPQLNPVVGIWSLIHRNLANPAFADPEYLISAARRELRTIQYRSWLIDGILAGPGLTPTTSLFGPQQLSE